MESESRAAKDAAVAQAAATPSAPEPTPPLVPAAPPPPPKPHARLELRPSYSFINDKDSNATSQLSGMNYMDIALHTDLPITDVKYIRIDAEYSSQKFKPSPAEAYPEQSEVSWQDIRISAHSHSVLNEWGYGGVFRTTSYLARDSYASVAPKKTLLVGGSVEYFQKWDDIEYYGNASLLAGTEYGASMSQNYRFHIGDRVITGATISVDYLLHSGGNTMNVMGQLILGFEF